MAINASCPKCGKTYQVKDDFAGKKFRCKACEGVVSVPTAKAASGDPWDNLDLDSFQDQNPYGDADAEAPAAPRRRTAGKKKSRSRSGGMPPTVMVAIGCEVVLILFFVFNIVKSMVGGDLQDGLQLSMGVCFVLFAIMVNGGAAFGYVKRQNTVRWISVVLTSITGLTCFGCGIFALFLPAMLAENLPPDAPIEEGAILFEGIMLIIASIVRFTLLTCLLLRPTSDWFEG